MIADYNDLFFAYRRLSALACDVYGIRSGDSPEQRFAAAFYDAPESSPSSASVSLSFGGFAFVSLAPSGDAHPAGSVSLFGLRVTTYSPYGGFPGTVSRVRLEPNGMGYLSVRVE